MDWQSTSTANITSASLDANTTYTIKAAYDNLGNVAYKYWKTSDPEPDWVTTGQISGFISETTAWLDIGFSSNSDSPNIYVDNLLFCSGNVPFRSSAFAQAATQIPLMLAQSLKLQQQPQMQQFKHMLI